MTVEVVRSLPCSPRRWVSFAAQSSGTENRVENQLDRVPGFFDSAFVDASAQLTEPTVIRRMRLPASRPRGRRTPRVSAAFFFGRPPLPFVACAASMASYSRRAAAISSLSGFAFVRAAFLLAAIVFARVSRLRHWVTLMLLVATLAVSVANRTVIDCRSDGASGHHPVPETVATCIVRRRPLQRARIAGVGRTAGWSIRQ